MPLRPYQQDAVSASDKDLSAGITRQLIVVPTGGGKTAIAAERMRLLRNGGQGLFLVHREELAQQAAETFRKRYPHIRVGIEMAESKADVNSDHIIVASVPTLYTGRIDKFDPDRFPLIIADEAHLSVSPEWLKVLSHFGCDKRDRPGLFLGITATPSRHDGIGLEALYDSVTYDIPIKRLCLEGIKVGPTMCTWLCPPRSHRISTGLDLSNVRVSRGDFVPGSLGKAVNTPERNRSIVRHHRDLGEGMPGIVFCASVQHSHDVATEFRAAGISAASIWGEMPKNERRRTISAYRAGEIDVLTSVDALSVGFDSPRASVAHMARPSLSGLWFRQAVGRVMRPHPAPESYRDLYEEGAAPSWHKQYCIIVDYVDNTTRHDLQTVPSIMGLPPHFNCKGKNAISELTVFKKLMDGNPLMGSYCQQATCMEEITERIDRVDLMAPPEVPDELRKFTKLGWTQVIEGSYHLPTFDGQTLELRQNALGQWDVSTAQRGARGVSSRHSNIKDAIAHAESLIPQDMRRYYTRSAKWKVDPPTFKQCAKLFHDHPPIKKQFRNPDEFYSYANRQHSNGNKAYSKGGVSYMLETCLLRRSHD